MMRRGVVGCVRDSLRPGSLDPALAMLQYHCAPTGWVQVARRIRPPRSAGLHVEDRNDGDYVAGAIRSSEPRLVHVARDAGACGRRSCA